MSIQWTLIVIVMYIELAATVLLLLPFISPQRWNKFFKSAFLRSIGNMAHVYFKIFLGLLTLLFVDAIREMRKYNLDLSEQQKSDHSHHLDSDLQSHMRLFRAQRNFYISGFSLFLWVVLQRLTTLISKLAVTLAEKEAAMKQAQSASATASQLLKDGKEVKGDGHKETDLANTVNELTEKNRKLKAEHEASLKQAASVMKEYDRLLEEHSKMQKQVSKLTGDQTSKKGD